jgi:hypothetical protein
MTEHFPRSTVSAAELEKARKELIAMPLWQRAEILGRIAAQTGEPIYEIEKVLRQEKSR